MARISGVELPDQAKVSWALTRIKGIGPTRAAEVMKTSGVATTKRIKDLSIEEISAISAALERFPTEGDLIRSIRENIQRLREIGSYRGMRHARGLPVRGQRTRSNARTKRGKRKTVGSFRKEVLTQSQPEGKEKE
jgi:small subunit ribosomal protein S13